MSLVVPNASKIAFMFRLADSSNPTVPTTLKLFQNNYTPVAGSVIGDLTEATFSGYTAKTLTGLSVSGSLDSGNRAFATWTAVSWTKSGATGNNVYGYYVISAAGALLYLERFDGAPINMMTDGNVLGFTPVFTNKSQFSNS